MVVEAGKLDDVDELANLDLVFFAILVDNLAVEGFGDAYGGAASGENIVEESEVECVALGDTGGDVGKTVVDMVGTIFLHYLYVAEVTLGVGKLAFLTDWDNVPDELRLREQGGGEKEAPCLDCHYVGAVDGVVDVGDELLEGFLVRKERDDVYEVNARFGKVGIMVNNVNVVHY